MNRSTVKLVLAASVLYFALIFLVRGFFPSEITTPLYFLVGPLLLVVLVIVSDLAYRATAPAEALTKSAPGRRLAHEVRLLTQQIDVGTRASPKYFDTVLLARLREILVERVSLETGMDRPRVRDVLSNRKLGPGLLQDRELYNFLYTEPPPWGSARLRLLKEAVTRIEAWKP